MHGDRSVGLNRLPDRLGFRSGVRRAEEHGQASLSVTDICTGELKTAERFVGDFAERQRMLLLKRRRIAGFGKQAERPEAASRKFLLDSLEKAGVGVENFPGSVRPFITLAAVIRLPEQAYPAVKAVGSACAARPRPAQALRFHPTADLPGRIKPDEKTAEQRGGEDDPKLPFLHKRLRFVLRKSDRQGCERNGSLSCFL